MTVVRYTADQVRALGHLTRGPARVDQTGGIAAAAGRIEPKTITCLRSRGLVGVLSVDGGEAVVLTPRGREALGIGEVRL